MSYCRKGPDSDVYVLRVLTSGPPVSLITTADEAESLAGLPSELVCHDCALSDGSEHRESSPAGMLVHLAVHRDAGHLVPESALTRLRSESGALWTVVS